MLTVGLLFWILYIVGLVVFGIGLKTRPFVYSDLFWWVLIFLLGCGTFGFPVKF